MYDMCGIYADSGRYAVHDHFIWHTPSRAPLSVRDNLTKECNTETLTTVSPYMTSELMSVLPTL